MSIGVPGTSPVLNAFMRWPGITAAVVASQLVIVPVEVPSQPTTELKFDPPAAGASAVPPPKPVVLPKAKKNNG